MDLALETPTELMEEILPLTDFYFSLTHLVLEDKKYAEFYSTHRDKLLILDTSTNELGTPSPVESILEAAEIVQPDIVVPPDFLGDSRSTIEHTSLFLDKKRDYALLPVIQGRDLKDCYRCADAYLKMGFKCCAVPYDVTCKKEDPLSVMAGMRQRLVVGLVGLFDWVHLLGFINFEELGVYKLVGNGCFLSLDTGSPVMHGLLGLRYGRDPLQDKSKPTMDKMHLGGDLDSVWYNLTYLRKEINGL